jgi:hypothetical protein
VITALRTHNYEYNVVSPRAKMLCDLFKEQAVQQQCLADKICRHIRSLGFKVPNLSEKLRMSRVDVPKVHNTHSLCWMPSWLIMRTRK